MSLQRSPDLARLHAGPSTGAPSSRMWGGPRVAEKAEPVFPEHALNPIAEPAAPLHVLHENGDQVVEVCEGGGNLSGAEVDEKAAVPVVATDPVEELAGAAVRKVGTDSNLLLANNVQQVFYGVEVVVGRRIVAAA